MQKYKSVYYADMVAPDNARPAGLTLAFGAFDEALYESIAGVSSLQIRQWLGHEHYRSLEQAAREDGRSVNAYCLRQLQTQLKKTLAVSESGNYQLALEESPPDLGLQATFRGGAHEPLQGWYPYLEGYSPAFVEHVRQKFAPSAQRILDPFAGTGTAPLTLARQGLAAFYCEVNPLLQRQINAKIAVLALPLTERRQISVRLRALAQRFDTQLTAAPCDARLPVSFRCVFGKAQFFNAAAFDDVLRARSLIDALAREDEPLAALLEVACIAALVPVSLLIRRGDLRYRTPAELVKGTPTLGMEVQARLLVMADDLLKVQTIVERPVMLADSALSLHKVPYAALDAVITSPPYLNGTNYFRNTKIELWFIGCLQTAADLTGFRAKAVTGGINDVGITKLGGNVPLVAQGIQAELERNAYDRRIPQMAASYFAEMALLASGISTHLKPGGRVMLDIGDSCYGGVRVPTDLAIKQIFADQGLRPVADLTLRQRASRDGRPLRQALLVFEHEKRLQVGIAEEPTIYGGWKPQWAAFKQQLPHQQGLYAKRNWGHGRHSLCSYQGKMKPALAHFLVDAFVPEKGRVLDPFGGTGTIGLEAALLGRASWSFDISPAALHIATGKLSAVTAAQCEAVLADLEHCLKTQTVRADQRAAATGIRFNGALPDYFADRTFDEILLARKHFMQQSSKSAATSMVLACLLHILHGNRPYALSRRSHPITPFAPTGETEYRALMPRLKEKLARVLTEPLPAHFVPGTVLEQDACGTWPHSVDGLDAIVTSPPFFDSTRFYLANWMRLWFCGWENSDFKTRPQDFVDERQKRSFAVYEPLLRQARERLKPGGVLVLHLGESRKCDMAAALTHTARHWFAKAEVFREDVGHCESHGIRDKGTVTAHQFLVLE